MVVVDIIILSYAREVQLKELTQQTIDTLLASENSSKIQFKVIVLESEKSIEPHQYPCSTTIYPKEPFGFHRYLNIGLENTSADYVCFCNNDLIFEKGWATAILDSVEKDSELLCLNPYCPGFHEERFPEISSDITYGYTNGIHFTGWCFFTKRILFDTIGPFDDHFKFWFCDDDFRLTLQKFGIKNALIKTSRVKHLYSETLAKVPSKKKIFLKYVSLAYYKYKWEHHSFLIYLYETLKYNIKIVLSRD